MSTNLDKQETCGVVMPISTIDGCSEAHWMEVLNILRESISDAGFNPNLVSDSDDSGIIHKRIIENLYDNPIVVCDVSCKNPNVMFELGMRLAFDKPTIIIKDNKTSYTFDTSNIEHLEYPRDLRFSTIVEFKRKLTEKILATYSKSQNDSNYSTFLKHFGSFKVAKIEKEEVSGQEFIIEELKSIRRAMNKSDYFTTNKLNRDMNNYGRKRHDIDICLGDVDSEIVKRCFSLLQSHPSTRNPGVYNIDEEHTHILADVDFGEDIDKIKNEIDILIEPQLSSSEFNSISHFKKVHGKK